MTKERQIKDYASLKISHRIHNHFFFWKSKHENYVVFINTYFNGFFSLFSVKPCLYNFLFFCQLNQMKKAKGC